MSVQVGAEHEDGFMVNSFSGDDWAACRDFVKDKVGIPRWQPPKREEKQKPTVVERYTYLDADGAKYMQVTRWSNKNFTQSRWDGERWQSGKPDGPKLPYRLNEILAADPDEPIFIVEGEKAANTLNDYGLLATTSTEGAGKWTNDLNHWFKGRSGFIIPDNDSVGRKHAQMVHEALPGFAVVDLPDRAPKAGADDWLASGHTKDELMAFALNPPEVVPDLFEEGPPDEEPPIEGFIPFTADDFTGEMPAPRPWAFGSMLLHRTVTAIAAPPGTGKSTWAIQLAIAFSQGREFGGMKAYRTGPVWLWNNEDDGDELNRRTLASCMNMDVNPVDLAGRLYLNSGSDRQLIVAREEGRGVVVSTPDVARVIQIIKEKGIKLLIVDPFAETYEVESENSNDTMKRVAAMYRRIAQETGIAVLLIAHTPKGQNSDKNAGSIDALRGAGAIAGVARSIWTMFEMSDQDAEDCDVPKDRKHLYIRLDDAKANMSLKTGKASWWMRQGQCLNNAADGYPDDTVGVLVSVDFASKEEKKAETNAQFVERIADEIVRICERNGWTTKDKTAPLNQVINGLEPVRTGVRSTKARDIFLNDMAPFYAHEGWLIVVTEDRKAASIRRTIHIERKEVS